MAARRKERRNILYSSKFASWTSHSVHFHSHDSLRLIFAHGFGQQLCASNRHVRLHVSNGVSMLFVLHGFPFVDNGLCETNDCGVSYRQCLLTGEKIPMKAIHCVTVYGVFLADGMWLNDIKKEQIVDQTYVDEECGWLIRQGHTEVNILTTMTFFSSVNLLKWLTECMELKS